MEISALFIWRTSRPLNHLTLIACADLDINRAQAQAEKYQIPKAYTVKELLADPEIDLVINLTIPKAHAEICIQALESGKHVYVEKPLAVTSEEATEILDVAKKTGFLLEVPQIHS